MANRFPWLLAACALLLFTLSAGAAVPAGSEYVLGAEDIIEIVVKNHSDLNKTAAISQDGTILLAEIGEVKAAGLTTRKLAANIQTELEKTLNNVAVNVTVKEVHVNKLAVRVIGAARAAGVMEIKPNWRLMDLVASAGGFTAKPTSVNGRIFRGTDVLTLNVAEAFAHPEGPANILLESDDLILFDEKEKLAPISVVGQVEKAGAFELEPTTTFSTLMTQTGGPTPRAALNKAYVLRDGVRIPVDLTDAVAGLNPPPGAPEFKLQPKDILVIPENTDRYSIIGEMRQTGAFPYPATGKVTVLQVYTQAGGASAQGDLKNAGIIRFVQGRYTRVPIDIAKLTDPKRPSIVDPPMEPGDTLYIPPKNSRHGLDWSNILTPLSALSLLGLRFGGR